MKSKVPQRLLLAQVAGLDPSGWSKTIIINKGTKDGVAKGMAVIAPGGIVGHVIKDFDWSACTGTHAISTGFVGNLLITKFNLVKGSWEIRFKVDVKKDLF